MTMDSRTRWLALYVLCLGDLMIVLDGTIVNVALPSIRDDLGFSQTSLAWVVNAYLLTFGGFLLLGGRLGDLFGHRRLFLIGVVDLHSRLARLRHRHLAGDAHRRSRRAGNRRRNRLGGRALAADDALHRAGRPGEGDGGLRFRPLGRRRDRRARRRDPHRPAQLALDLPRQPPGRRAGLHPLAPAASGRTWPRRHRPRRRRRRDHRDGLADARRLRDRQRQREGLGLRPDPRAARGLCGAPCDLPRDRSTHLLSADAARPVPEPQRLVGERRRRADGRRPVRVLLLLRALSAAGARVHARSRSGSRICRERSSGERPRSCSPTGS